MPDEVLDSGGLRVSWTGPGAEPIVTVTLDRPATRNAQTPATWRALAAVGAAVPPSTRAVVVRSEGPVFSSGIDLRVFSPEGIDDDRVLARIAALDDDGAADLIAEFQAGFSWLHDIDVPTVAVVQGAAVGAGFQLALACDLRVAASAARFAMRETSLGLVPDLTGTHPLVDAVGFSRALELCVTGRWVGADEALRLGLVASVTDPGDLEVVVDDLLESLLSAPGPAVAATKRVLRHALSAGVHEQRRMERETQVRLIRDLMSG